MKGVYNNLDEIVKLIIGKKCVSCGKTFEIGNFELGFYEHSDGWFVKSLNKRLWIYVRCLNCDYQNAIWKLGL